MFNLNSYASFSRIFRCFSVTMELLQTNEKSAEQQAIFVFANHFKTGSY